MDLGKIAMWLVVIGALVHLILGLGQGALLAAVPFLNIIQIAVGLAGIYLIIKKKV